MNIIILGKPGSGKGTACKLLPNDFGLKLITAGDLLRTERNSGSELGNKIASIIDDGNLVSDEMITEIISKEILKTDGDNLLIDGYPRTIGQAKSLEEMIGNLTVIWLEVSDETTIKRNLNRGLTSGRPDDSNVDIIKQRLLNYKKDSYPLKEYYESKSYVQFIEINAEGSSDDVYSEIVNCIV